MCQQPVKSLTCHILGQDFIFSPYLIGKFLLELGKFWGEGETNNKDQQRTDPWLSNPKKSYCLYKLLIGLVPVYCHYCHGYHYTSVTVVINFMTVTRQCEFKDIKLCQVKIKLLALSWYLVIIIFRCQTNPEIHCSPAMYNVQDKKKSLT